MNVSINNNSYFNFELQISREAKILHEEINKTHRCFLQMNYKELLKLTRALLKKLNREDFDLLYEKYQCNQTLKSYKHCLSELASEIINNFSDLDLKYLVL